ncbi:hypothetical protein [Pararhizobium arenae]|jgi:hypothetical protein|uniref:hypothetical protein n=1 Tax=Pararhizobium arenae TaxID=1856850 RepID=UPI00094ABD69|nr:hypothetical protein [Pararhizobium arenae]
MNKQVIEFAGEAVGVVVPEADYLKFVAVKYHVWDLDSRRFGSADEARAAVRQLVAGNRLSANQDYVAGAANRFVAA